jgi:hypothetical protein
MVFVYKVGKKIGIVVYSSIGVDKDALLDRGQLEDGIHVRDLYGEANNVMIYTVEITRVGSGHIA